MIRIGTALCLLLLTSACAASADGPSAQDSGEGPPTQLTVAAASSLTSVFPQIAREFARERPDITVRFTFAGSNAIIEQVRAGAPIDVVATASRGAMDEAVAARLVEAPVDFARNALAIALPPTNPAGIRSLEDLANPRVSVALCSPAVPCGVATAALLERNRIAVSPVTEELDVRAVLGKVISDEVDAGVVYVTDVIAAGADVSSVAIPADQNVSTDSVIASVADSRSREAAQAFVTFVASQQELLRAAGFAPPGAPS